MGFDDRIPFSRAKSYMVISYNDAGFNGADNEEGLFIRTIHRSSYVPFVARILPQKNGKNANFTCDINPVEFTVKIDNGQIKLLFADEDTILVKGEGDVALTLDFLTEGRPYDYIYGIPVGGSVCYMANCYKNNSKYLIEDVQQGNILLDQSWNICTADYSKISIDADNGKFLFSFKEIETEWDGQPVVYDYQKCLQNVTEEFDSFCKSMPSVPSRYEDARTTAAYINWSCLVKKKGFLTRDAMYMSKNWMCSVWSWDHCFNAIALSYNDPEAAWDQFMLMFDFQDKFGRLPDSVNDCHVTWNYCKPPIHGWALDKMMMNMKLSMEQLSEVYNKLSKWTNWWFDHRDSDSDGICEYVHGNDSGWDNSTAFSELPPVETPELQAFLVIQMEVLSGLAGKLGNLKGEKVWTERSEDLLNKMLSHCFEDGMPSVKKSGTHEMIINQSLLPFITVILGNRLPEKFRDKIVDVLKNGKFLTEYGYATEKPSSDSYISDGYWRGPIWAPSTILLLDGLKKCGEDELVCSVSEKFCMMINNSGCAENFDALTGIGLRDRSYTWTASIFLIMAHEYLS